MTPRGSLPPEHPIFQARDALATARRGWCDAQGRVVTASRTCDDAIGALDALIEQAVVEYRCPLHGDPGTCPTRPDEYGSVRDCVPREQWVPVVVLPLDGSQYA